MRSHRIRLSRFPPLDLTLSADSLVSTQGDHLGLYTGQQHTASVPHRPTAAESIPQVILERHPPRAFPCGPLVQLAQEHLALD